MSTDPRIRTARTILAGIATAAILVPELVRELSAAGIDLVVIWPRLAIALAVLGAITRVMATPAGDAVLDKIGLGRQPKHLAGPGDAQPPAEPTPPDA